MESYRVKVDIEVFEADFDRLGKEGLGGSVGKVGADYVANKPAHYGAQKERDDDE